MVLYTCPMCSKEFNRKSSFLDHIENRKKPCNFKKESSINNADLPPDSSVAPDSSEKAPDSSEKAPDSSIKTQDFSAIPILEKIPNIVQEVYLSDNKIYKCDTCNLVFNKKYNLRRHQNGRCKMNQQQAVKEKNSQNNQINIDDLDIDKKTKTILNILLNQNKKIIDEMKQEMDKIKEENKEIKEENKEIKEENKEMKEKMSKIDRKNITKNINNNNNTTNNTNSHNTQNNTINNTIIVAHGKEELDKIELETIMKCLSTIKYREIVPNMAKHVYINDKKPENKNFCVVDMARNKCKYYDGNKWMTGKTTDKVNRIFDSLHTLLTDPFEKENINKTIEFIKANPKRFNEKWIKLSNTWLQSLYDEEDKENIENKLKILDEIKLIFYNNKDEILKTNP